MSKDSKGLIGFSKEPEKLEVKPTGGGLIVFTKAGGTDEVVFRRPTASNLGLDKLAAIKREEREQQSREDPSKKRKHDFEDFEKAKETTNETKADISIKHEKVTPTSTPKRVRDRDSKEGYERESKSSDRKQDGNSQWIGTCN